MTTWEILRDSATYQEIVAEARAEAILDGIRHQMHQVLAMRFGPLPSWAVDLIESADNKALDRWTAQFFSATALEEILK